MINFLLSIQVLANYWDKSEHETDLLIKKFDRYSLVTKVHISDTSTTAIVIHILYYNYLQNCVKNDRVQLNQTLVDSYQ